MKTLRQALFVVAAVSALMIGTVAAAPFASATTGTLEITTNTTLTEDHYGEIVIAADNVTLDCAGHQVIGPSTGTGSTGVLLDGHTGVTVKNCHVTGGFQNGFYLVGHSSDNTLSGNVVTGGVNDGFLLEDSSNNNTLIGNTASGGDHGFMLIDVTGNVLANNQAQGNNTNIQLGNGPGTSTTGNTLIGNASRGSRDSGFNFYGADRNAVSNNVAMQNGFCGFEAQSGSYNTFTHNTAANNSQGFCVDAFAGPPGYAGPAVGNTFTRDVSNHNRDTGFVLYEESSGNLVTRSVARNNGIYDAVDFNAPGSNTWTNDNFGTTSPAGLG